MADRHQWEALYAFTVRYNVNLAKWKVSDDNATDTTVTNTGLIKSATSFKGSQLFVRTATGQNTGFVGTSGTRYFGLPLTNKPSWAPGQEYVEAEKAIGEPIRSAGTGYDYVRGSNSPTAPIEWQANPRTLIPFLWCLLHEGASEATAGGRSWFTFLLPDSTTSDVEAYMQALNKMSTSGADSQLLTDGVVTRMTLSSSEGGALEASCEILGRFLDVDFEAGGSDGDPAASSDAAHMAANMDFLEQYPLLHQNMDCVIAYGTDTYIASECESFELTITADIVPKRFNSRFPIRYSINGYTVEGTMRIPWGQTSAGGNVFSEYLLDTSVADGVDIDTFIVDFLWKDSRLAVDATYDNTSIDDTARVMADGDMRISIGAVVTDVAVEGEDESMLNISFQGTNIRSGNSITQRALGIYMTHHIGTAEGWGIP